MYIYIHTRAHTHTQYNIIIISYVINEYDDL